MKSVIILMNKVTEYRKPVFNLLAEKYKIVILHSGDASITKKDKYTEIIIKSKNFWKFTLHSVFNIRQIIKNYDVSIIMFDLYWPAYILQIFFRKTTKIILWGHRYNANKIASFLRNKIMLRADNLLLYGEEDINELKKNGIAFNKIKVAWNTIYVPNKENTSNFKKDNLIFVGRLQRRKEIDLLIKSFSSISKQIHPEIKLRIIGNGVILDELIELTHELNISNRVIFHGEIKDHKELALLFSQSFAYVSPAQIGLGLLHSFAYGVPTIVLKNRKHGPEIHNLKNDENSIICDNEKDLAIALKRICNNVKLTRRLGTNAFNHYTNQRSLEKMVNGIIESIEK